MTVTGVSADALEVDQVKPQRRLKSVDALRGVAALLVLLHHSPPLYDPNGPSLFVVLQPFITACFMGVGLFLVVSGFSIHLRWAMKPDADHNFSVRRFWARRFWRLYPTYWIALVVSIAIIAVFFDWQTAVDPKTNAYFTFSPDVNFMLAVLVIGANIAMVPFFDVAWSLALEEQIYAAYSVAIGWIRKHGVFKLVMVTLAISLAWRVGVQFITPSVPVGQFGPDNTDNDLLHMFFRQMPSRAFEFALGVAAAEVYVRQIRLPAILRSWWSAAMVLTVAVVLFNSRQLLVTSGDAAFYLSDIVLDPLFGVGFFILLMAMLNTKNTTVTAVSRPLAFVGVIAYSLYLLHRPLLKVITPLMPTDHTLQLLALPVMWAAVIALCWGFYRLAERRFVERAKQAS